MGLTKGVKVGVETQRKNWGPVSIRHEKVKLKRHTEIFLKEFPLTAEVKISRRESTYFPCH